MTALDQFERLESGGLWREGPDAQRRDVTVSFGKATLILSDNAGRPLAHWSLPAVQRQNSGTRPAVFSPDDTGTETLEIEDDLMVDAIEKVRKSLIRAQPHPGRLRGGFVAITLALLAAVALFWVPDAFVQKTLSVVPQSKRNEIGATILGHYQRLTGPTCRNPRGTAALGKLKDRLLGATSIGQFVVVQELAQGAAALPGGVVMIDRRLVEQVDDPAIMAGYILAAVAGSGTKDPLQDVLKAAGLQTTTTLFTTGDIPDAELAAHANQLKDATETATTPDALRAAFDAAAIMPGPYLEARRASAETYAAMEDLQEISTSSPLLDDGDWIRLQGICS